MHSAMFCKILVVVLTFIEFSISSDSKEWDYLVFTQHWPNTVCAEWRETGQGHDCTLPANDLWTVHGIWPTKVHEQGPFFCNNSWHFDQDKLLPILNDLELYWTNVERNTPLYSFWKHEWTKHGTCAAELLQLNSELNFFRQGLEWIQRYGMANILAKNDIKPGPNGYTIQQIHDSINELLNKNTIIECVVDKHTKQSFLSEIRICFNKNFRIVDCDVVKEGFENLAVIKESGNDILTNCDPNKPVIYLDEVPEPSWRRSESKPKQDYLRKLYKIYNVLQYLIWFTI